MGCKDKNQKIGPDGSCVDSEPPQEASGNAQEPNYPLEASQCPGGCSSCSRLASGASTCLSCFRGYYLNSSLSGDPAGSAKHQPTTSSMCKAGLPQELNCPDPVSFKLQLESYRGEKLLQIIFSVEFPENGNKIFKNLKNSFEFKILTKKAKNSNKNESQSHLIELQDSNTNLISLKHSNMSYSALIINIDLESAKTVEIETTSSPYPYIPEKPSDTDTPLYLTPNQSKRLNIPSEDTEADKTNVADPRVAKATRAGIIAASGASVGLSMVNQVGGCGPSSLNYLIHFFNILEILTNLDSINVEFGPKLNQVLSFFNGIKFPKIKVLADLSVFRESERADEAGDDDLDAFQRWSRASRAKLVRSNSDLFMASGQNMVISLTIISLFVFVYALELCLNRKNCFLVVLSFLKQVIIGILFFDYQVISMKELALFDTKRVHELPKKVLFSLFLSVSILVILVKEFITALILVNKTVRYLNERQRKREREREIAKNQQKGGELSILPKRKKIRFRSSDKFQAVKMSKNRRPGKSKESTKAEKSIGTVKKQTYSRNHQKAKKQKTGMTESGSSLKQFLKADLQLGRKTILAKNDKNGIDKLNNNALSFNLNYDSALKGTKTKKKIDRKKADKTQITTKIVKTEDLRHEEITRHLNLTPSHALILLRYTAQLKLSDQQKRPKIEKNSKIKAKAGKTKENCPNLLDRLKYYTMLVDSMRTFCILTLVVTLQMLNRSQALMILVVDTAFSLFIFYQILANSVFASPIDSLKVVIQECCILMTLSTICLFSFFQKTKFSESVVYGLLEWVVIISIALTLISEVLVMVVEIFVSLMTLFVGDGRGKVERRFETENDVNLVNRARIDNFKQSGPSIQMGSFRGRGKKQKRFKRALPERRRRIKNQFDKRRKNGEFSRLDSKRSFFYDRGGQESQRNKNLSFSTKRVGESSMRSIET